MGLFGRVFSPLKAGRSDIELTITAVAAAAAVEIIVQKPENYLDCVLADILRRARAGVDILVRQQPALKFLSGNVILDFACREIHDNVNKSGSANTEAIKLLWKDRRHYHDLYFLIVLMNDYSGHNLTRAREGTSRFSVDSTVKFNDICRHMVRNALHTFPIEPSAIDPMDFGMVNWETLEFRRR